MGRWEFGRPGCVAGQDDGTSKPKSGARALPPEAESPFRVLLSLQEKARLLTLDSSHDSDSSILYSKVHSLAEDTPEPLDVLAESPEAGSSSSSSQQSQSGEILPPPPPAAQQEDAKEIVQVRFVIM